MFSTQRFVWIFFEKWEDFFLLNFSSFNQFEIIILPAAFVLFADIECWGHDEWRSFLLSVESNFRTEFQHFHQSNMWTMGAWKGLRKWIFQRWRIEHPKIWAWLMAGTVYGVFRNREKWALCSMSICSEYILMWRCSRLGTLVYEWLFVYNIYDTFRLEMLLIFSYAEKS